MARYDYKCNECGEVHDITHSIHEDPEIFCEKCNGLCQRQISSKIYLYGTVGVDWNTDPSKVSDSMREKAKKATKRKQSF